MTPIRAIRKYCLNECKTKQRKLVRECDFLDCPLRDFRMGMRPETMRKRYKELSGQIAG